MIATIDDFSDRVPPVLVRELRAGLKSHAFEGMIALYLIVLTGTMLVMSLNDSSGKHVEIAILVIYGVTAALVMPVATQSGLSRELGGKRLGLLSLTRLHRREVAYSIAAAGLVRTLLLGALTVPYLGAAYFLGETSPTRALALMLSLTLLGTAHAAWFSVRGILVAGKSTGIRILLNVVLGYAFLSFAVPVEVVGIVGTSAAGAFGFDLLMWAACVIAAVIGIEITAVSLGDNFAKIRPGRPVIPAAPPPLPGARAH